MKNISLLRHAFQQVVERGEKEEGKKSTEPKKNQKKETEKEEKQSSAGKSAAKAADLFFGDRPSTLKDFILEHRNWCIKQMRKPLLHDFDEIFRKCSMRKMFQ